MSKVALSNVKKVYPGGFAAVKGVNLDIADGEFVVLVGPSGCGKSTTLRMIAGLEDVSEGSISIGQRVVNDVAPADRDIAMVFQNYALYPHMTVERNMGFALKMRGLDKAQIRQRVEHAARTLGIADLLDRKPKQLSGGQRQRVALGRAIVREPKAFLFDEPLSNLDAKLRVTTRGEIKALQQRLKTTTVYVTHDQEEAMTLGDRIVVMAQGLIQQIGPPLEVYRRPVNRFVAGFIGSPPMNFLAGTLSRNGSRIVFTEKGAAGAGATIELPARFENSLAGWIGKEVVLGFRPQALRDRVDGAEVRPIDVQADVIEPLGDHLDVIGRTSGGSRLVARLPARAQVAPGSTARLGVDADEAHVFEPGEYGKNLTA